MTYEIEYFEQASGVQPAEVFEDGTSAKLRGKLMRYAIEVAKNGLQLGGGIIKKCHTYPDLYEIRVRHSRELAREFCTVDDCRLVLLDGLVKTKDEATPRQSLENAAQLLSEYKKNRSVSREQTVEDTKNESLQSTAEKGLPRF